MQKAIIQPNFHNLPNQKTSFNLVTFLSMAEVNIKADSVINIIIKKFAAGPKVNISAAKALPILLLKCMQYIHHLIQFKKD